MPKPTTGPLATRKYALIKALATGGMGEIYLARMRGLEGFERLVVLKRLKPEVALRAENIAMFLDEVRLLASVQHANVVRIYDVGASGEGGYFYAMEYLHGQDLRSVMKSARTQGPLPLSLLVSAGAAVLSGLHHVHERNGADGKPLRIVHRDVSPANIYVTYEGEVKLLDFGIALAATRSTQTEAGVLKGKFRYMSPEQCRTDPVDRRSDIFSLGIVLWEMATGKSLFKTENDLKTLFAIVETDAAPISRLVPDFPPALERIIMKALQRDLRQRWQSAQEMQLALEEFALDYKLSLTSSGLARFMEERFAAELTAWREAQRSGKDLGAFVAEQLDQHGDDGSAPSATPSGSASGLTGNLEPPPNWRLSPSDGQLPQVQQEEERSKTRVVPDFEAPTRKRLPVAAVGATVLGAAGAALLLSTLLSPSAPEPPPPLPLPAPHPVEVQAHVAEPAPAAPPEPAAQPEEAREPPPPTAAARLPPAAVAPPSPPDPRPPRRVAVSKPPARAPNRPAAVAAPRVDKSSEPEKPAATWDKDSPLPP